MDEEKKILVIEDESGLANALSDALKRAGFSVEIAENGAVGLDMIVEFEPDLVLLDILMPKVDGITTLRDIRNDEKTKDLPVIVLSNFSEGDPIEKARELGVTQYLIKSDHKLKEIIETIQESL